MDLLNIVRQFGLPCFVKPNDSGSSFGVTKVKQKEELLPAIETAFKESDEVLIEAFHEWKRSCMWRCKNKKQNYRSSCY